MTATAAAAPAAPKARKPKGDKLDRELAIHTAHLRDEKKNVSNLIGTQQVKQFARMCKDADKDQLKMLSKSTGFEKDTLKVIGKFGEKELKKFEKDLAKRLRKANMEAFFAQLGEHGLEVKYKKGKSKSLDKIMSDVNGEKDSGSWSVWQILGACLAAGVVGVLVYEGYQYATGGTGLFGNYGGSVGDAFAGNTFDNNTGMPVAQMR